MDTSPRYLVRDLRYRESFNGGLFVLSTLIIVALEVPLNTAMAHWPAPAAMALATVLIPVGFGALGVAQAPLPIAVTVVVWTFGEMISFRRQRPTWPSWRYRGEPARTWARLPAPSRLG